ncbi:RNA 2',3'-cyclic phosphodiesterase [Aliikangiella maris]|uniref:RNA 2',3'-cyclic phosphodiesterase n=2 Tax=Aliikangiella maris TaxID=3162458 RepID=A0ABV2BRM0_9GAMM
MSPPNKTTSYQYRLFFAVEFDAATKTAILNIQQALQQLSEVKGLAVKGENFHITLCFIGEVKEKILEKILDGFQPLTLAPFTISLNDLLYWPKPQVLALTLKDSEQHLNQCKKAIERQLVELNYFQFDKREYFPHITLFRQVEIPPVANQYFYDELSIKSFSLMLSEQTHSGVRYQTLERYPLNHPNIKQQLLGR